MRIKTSELTEQGLMHVLSLPDLSWQTCGPIIERVKIDTAYEHNRWFAYESLGDCCDPSVGPTLLIAAMRCYVARELGEEVEVPDELA